MMLRSFLLIPLFLLGCTDSAVNHRPGVAILQEPKNEVSVRRAHDLVWTKVEHETTLSNYDAIRTGKDSTATIRYSDESVILVSENTMLIVIDRKDASEKIETVVSLPVGSIQGKLSANHSTRRTEIIIKTNRGWVRTDNTQPADFKTTVGRDGELQVTNQIGEIKIQSLGKEKIVRSKETAIVRAPAVVPSPGASGTPMLGPEEVAETLPAVGDHEWGAAPAPEAGLDLFMLNEPRENAVVQTKDIRISGEVSGRLKVFMNDIAIMPEIGGRFSLVAPVSLGRNVFKFKIVGPGPTDVQYESRTVTRK